MDEIPMNFSRAKRIEYRRYASFNKFELTNGNLKRVLRGKSIDISEDLVSVACRFSKSVNLRDDIGLCKLDQRDRRQCCVILNSEPSRSRHDIWVPCCLRTFKVPGTKLGKHVTHSHRDKDNRFMQMSSLCLFVSSLHKLLISGKPYCCKHCQYRSSRLGPVPSRVSGMLEIDLPIRSRYDEKRNPPMVEPCHACTPYIVFCAMIWPSRFDLELPGVDKHPDGIDRLAFEDPCECSGIASSGHALQFALR